MRISYANEPKLRAQMAKRGWRTGRSVVVDDATGEVFHVGGDGFEYP
jgi:hypothetical protein